MGSKKTAAVPNWKKKKWYELVAPASFSGKVLGEATVDSPDKLVGKTVAINMMTLLGTPKKQNFRAKFVVTEVLENKGVTKPILIEMIPSGIKRLIKAGKERLDASFVVKSKDGIALRIKPLIVTKGKTSNSILTDVQKKTIELLTDIAAKTEYESLFVNITQSTLQRDMKKSLDKVYPIKLFEIRSIQAKLN